ncbi:MAG: ABC transporter permease, partial [Proteobacteria bacterium]|nr:ABC transporter permease [Pseudomonadota bacterium]
MSAPGLGPADVPRWVTHVVIPVFNLAVAFLISGIIIALIGENPFRAFGLLLRGAFGYGDAIGFTLYYTTNFIF